MRSIVAGYKSFVAKTRRQSPQLFETLALGQQPEALVITCSDSRISPSVLTGAKLGEIFVVRNAGNMVPRPGVPGGEAASVEFAVTQLGVKEIIIIGHSQCGAMKGLMYLDATAEQMPLVAQWLQHASEVRERVLKGFQHVDEATRLQKAGHENVKQQLEHLASYGVIREGLARGSLRLHGWYFELETGTMYTYDAVADAFEPLVDAAEEPVSTAYA
jgi:carbonic anhydrase